MQNPPVNTEKAWSPTDGPTDVYSGSYSRAIACTRLNSCLLRSQIYLWIATDRVFGRAVAHADAIGSKRVCWTTQIARWTEKPGRALAITKQSVAMSAVTLLRTRHSAVVSVEATWTTVGAGLAMNARRTQAVTRRLREREREREAI